MGVSRPFADVKNIFLSPREGERMKVRGCSVASFPVTRALPPMGERENSNEMETG